MRNLHEVADDLRQPTRDLRKVIPEPWRGFGELHRSAMAGATG
jgi:hypothetical protein